MKKTEEENDGPKYRKAVQVRITEDMHAKLIALARKRGIGHSILVRNWVMDKLKEAKNE